MRSTQSTRRSRGYNRYEPPSPVESSQEEHEEFFKLETDRFNEKLPQPLHRIQKVLDEIFDNVWYQIESSKTNFQVKINGNKDSEKVLYEQELLLSKKVKHIAVTDDILVVAFKNELLFYNTEDMLLRFKYELEIAESQDMDWVEILNSDGNFSIVFVKFTEGTLTVFGLSGNIILLTLDIKKSEEGDFVKEVILSPDKGYMGIICSSDTKDNFLEILSIPQSEWIKQLNEMDEQKKETCDESTHDDHTSTNIEITFTKPQLLMKLNPPGIKSCYNILSSTMKLPNSNDAMFVSESNHLMSQDFFNFARAQLPNNKFDKKNKLVNLCFLHSTKQIEKCKDNMFYSDITVLWKGSNCLIFYKISQTRDSKLTPYQVLPHSHVIKDVIANSKTNLLATILVNNTITVYDRTLRRHLKILTFHDGLQVTNIDFACTNTESLEYSLIYSTSDGKLWQLLCDKKKAYEQICLDDRSSDISHSDHVVKVKSEKFNLIFIVWASGEIMVYSLINRKSLCYLEIFNEETRSAGKAIRLLITSSRIFIGRDEKKKTEDQKEKNYCRLFKFDTKNTILEHFKNQHCQPI